MKPRALWAGLFVLLAIAGVGVWIATSTDSQAIGSVDTGNKGPSKSKSVSTSHDPMAAATRTVEPPVLARPEKTQEQQNEEKGQDEKNAPTWEASIDRLSTSFLTTEPQYRELEHLLGDVIGMASVDEASVVQDEKGTIRGKLKIAGSERTATFERSGDWWRVDFPSKSPDNRFPSNTVSISYSGSAQADKVKGSINVQFHPNTSESRHDFESETLVGWGTVVTLAGTKVLPLSAECQNGTWKIGWSKNFDSKGDGRSSFSVFNDWASMVGRAKPASK